MDTLRGIEEIESEAGYLPFGRALVENGLTLIREKTVTCQVNLGYLCNLTCHHCHVEAGPHRTELMDETTVRQVTAYIKRSGFTTLDITGGAPEMNPNLPTLIELVRPFVKTIMVRSNLTLLTGAKKELLETFQANKVAIVASLPSLSKAQTEAQRGGGVFAKSVSAIKMLNELGYAKEGSGLELNLVANPAGAFLSAPQENVERRFRTELKRKWGVIFNNLFALSNVPIGRFEKWLHDSGNLDNYLQRLAESFNPKAISGVMCKSQISVAWDGSIYDCDFHLAKGIDPPSGKTHVGDTEGPPPPGSPIAVADHCYTCTAGAGFTCGGAIES